MNDPKTYRLLMTADDTAFCHTLAENFDSTHVEVLFAAGHAAEIGPHLANGVDLLLICAAQNSAQSISLCEICRQITSVPIVLYGEFAGSDITEALRLGADDCIAPCPPTELSARLEAHLRREHRQKYASSTGPFTCGRFVLYPALLSATLDGRPLNLTTHEFLLLTLFCRHPGTVLSRERIYLSVWGSTYGDMGTVAVHINRLRSKLGKNSSFIITVWGKGYRFSPY